jgi:hypothetical protein
VARQWTVLRVVGSERTPPWHAVAALVARLRAADSGALWSFQRDRSCIAVSWCASPELSALLTDELTVAVGELGWSVVGDTYEGPTAKYGSAGLLDTATVLADISSDLALACAQRCLSDETVLAVAHLSRLIELVDESARAGLLFQCWEHWSRELEPRRRREVADLAVSRAPGIVRDACSAFGRSVDWDGYLSAVADAVAGQAGPYLLFDHAHLTHQRLGIGVAAEAFAARVVRIGLGVGRRELQSVS